MHPNCTDVVPSTDVLKYAANQPDNLSQPAVRMSHRL
jgi:hypothetical protein